MRNPATRPLLPAFLLFLLPALPAPGANITVDTAVDADAADGFCSLREAILAANTDAVYRECPAGAGADRIGFALTLPATISVGSDLPAVTATVAIRGPGSGQLAIDGLDLHRLWNFASPGGAWFLLEDLTVQHGYTLTGLGPDGGGIYVGPGDTAVLSRLVVSANTAANGGGGITVDAELARPTSVAIVECSILDNVAQGPTGGGGILVVDGASVVVDGSALVGNRATAEHGSGGAILNQRSPLTVRRSTLSGNVANESGGAIFLSAAGADASLTLIDSTISDNIADGDADLHGDGGGIDTSIDIVHVGTISLTNTIVAGNQDDGLAIYPDLALDAAAVVNSSGFNLVGANDGAAAFFPTGGPNANGDFVGTAAAPLDPMLQPLNFNQGTTLNHRPVLDPASPVIDHGACPESAGDQRGHGVAAQHLRAFEHPAVPTHAASDGCDIGAVERGATPRSAAQLFVDGFELGHSLLWSAEAL